MPGRAAGFIKRGFHGTARVTLWLVFVALVACTVLLFTTTGGSVPAAFRSWEELGCVDPEVDTQSPNVSAFHCMSDCGQYYMTSTWNGNTQVPQWNYTVREWTTAKIICHLEQSNMIPNRLIVSTDGSLIAANTSFGLRGDAFLVFDGSNGHVDREFSKDIGRFQFSPDGKTVAFEHGGMVHLNSLHPRTAIKTLTLEKSREVAELFYDSNARPKALVFQRDDQSKGAEVWDILSGRRDWRIDGLRAIPGEWSPTRFAFPASSPDSARLFMYYSLADGKAVPLATEATQQSPGNFSHDGRFLAYKTDQPSILDRFVPEGKEFEWRNQLFWLTKTFPNLRVSNLWTIVDVQIGTSWPTRKASRSFSAYFNEHDPVLTTFGRDGAYDWDLPPRQRWFTPWAWPALMATLALGYYLWPWRGRNAKNRLAGTNQTQAVEAVRTN